MSESEDVIWMARGHSGDRNYKHEGTEAESATSTGVVLGRAQDKGI